MDRRYEAMKREVQFDLDVRNLAKDYSNSAFESATL